MNNVRLNHYTESENLFIDRAKVVIKEYVESNILFEQNTSVNWSKWKENVQQAVSQIECKPDTLESSYVTFSVSDREIKENKVNGVWFVKFIGNENILSCDFMVAGQTIF
jgi:hypothetical protein